MAKKEDKELKKEGADNSAPSNKAPAKTKAIEEKIKKLLSKLNTDYKNDDAGIGCVFADDSWYPTIPIPTGLEEIDEAAGIGGFANNAIIEFHGPESSGKSYLAQHLVAQAQKRFPDRYAVYVDLEGGTTNERMQQIGIDTSQLIKIEPCMAEHLFEKIYTLIKQDILSVVVIDSVVALQPKAEAEADLEDQNIALIARFLSRALAKLAPLCRTHQTAVVLINQLRSKMNAVRFQNPDDTPCGRALKFYAQIRCSIRKHYDEKEKSYFIRDTEGNAIGQHVSVTFIKNKFAPPERNGKFILYFDEPNMIAEVINKSKKIGVWRIWKGEVVYKKSEDEKVNYSSYEDFFNAVIMNDEVMVIAERIMLAQAKQEIEEVLLEEGFDMNKLKILVEKERDRLLTINNG